MQKPSLQAFNYWWKGYLILFDTNGHYAPTEEQGKTSISWRIQFPVN